MDLIKKALQSTKQQRDTLLSSNNNQQTDEKNDHNKNNQTKKRKWVKRGDLEAERERQYLEEMNAQKRMKKSSAESVVSSTDTSTKNGAKNQTNNHSSTGDEIEVDLTNILPRELVIKALREYGQPITLFGETDTDRYKRLRVFEITTHDDQLLRLKHQNDFAQHLRKQQQDLLNKQAVGDGGQDDSLIQDHSLSAETIVADINRDLESREDEINLLVDSTPLQPEPRQGQSDCDYVRSFWRRILKLWDMYLQNERSEDEKRSTQGRIEVSIYKQSKDHLRPLLKLLKKQSLQSDILIPLKKICMNVAQREYVKAHGIYLELSIGNAPWPMGVTMVGIHERSARERIETGQIAHILNDEQQRKYIQSIKRMITFCQKKYPTDPSRMVL